MNIDRKSYCAAHSGLAFCLVAALLMAVPAQAADISWTSTRASSSILGNGKFSSVGTAVLGTGEAADVTSEGMDGPRDDKGRPTVTMDSVMKFKDGSTITMRYAGYRNPDTLEIGGGGEFVGGTGKYAGITGKYTTRGLAGKSESVGTYTLAK